VNSEDNGRRSVYPHVEVEPTADVCPSGPVRDAGDQGRDGRVIRAGSRSEPARQGRGRGRSFDSSHGIGPPAHSRKGPPASMAQSCRSVMTAGTAAGLSARLITIVEASSWSVEPLSWSKMPDTSLPCQQSHRPVSLLAASPIRRSVHASATTTYAPHKHIGSDGGRVTLTARTRRFQRRCGPSPTARTKWLIWRLPSR